MDRSGRRRVARRGPRAILSTIPKTTGQISISEHSSVQNFTNGIRICFPVFLVGVEMRALLHAATDEPRPEGESDIFLRLYKETGCWNESRRGLFPFDIVA